MAEAGGYSGARVRGARPTNHEATKFGGAAELLPARDALKGAAACLSSSIPERDERLARRLAGSTGLEPAASAVTGQRSNQLNYDPNLLATRPPCSGHAPPVYQRVVGGTGLEPVTAGV